MTVQIFLLTHRTPFWRLDAYPFLLAYLTLLVCGLSFFEELILLKLIFLTLMLFHGFIYIMGHWSPRFKSYIRYYHLKGLKKEQLSNASHVKVGYSKPGRPTIWDICDLSITTFGDPKAGEECYESYHFSFHYKKFIYDEEKQDFYHLKPVLKNSLKYYYEEENEKNALFDTNELNIPIKKFTELLQDHLMEPFSFFQFFSVSLWLVDENRYYAMFTLFMLFMTACILVVQRIKTMMMFRQMKLNPHYIMVYRNHKWVKISSLELDPGDICFVTSSNSLKKAEVTNAITDEQYLKEQIPFAQKLPPVFFRSENVNSDSHKLLPCDLLLLSGGCVVNEAILTGESIPQIKDSIEREDLAEILDIKNKHKNSVLFCGTEVLQTFPNQALPPYLKSPPPGTDGCVCYVLRTGFDTSKGKLIRTVLFNNDNILTKQTDAFLIIGILLIFSIISSVYILNIGLADPTRDRNKLFLRCILIITTVVPPELPMILTIAVNNSLMLLQRKKIFCTEPFRMPLGGKISVCAFDKTGTLTSDELMFKGVIDDLENFEELKTFDNCHRDVQTILAGCHSLVYVDKKLLGDPIEMLFFKSNSYDYSSIDKTARSKKMDETIKIRRTFPFRSDLKRMSTIVQISSGRSGSQSKMLMKGAPEVIETLLTKVPANYKSAFEYYTRKGFRVLALAQRLVENEEDMMNAERGTLEKGFVFAGFFICDSPLKKDTLSIIRELQSSKYRIIMITGDNHLTALKISRELALGPQNSLTLCLENDNKELFWADESDGRVKFDMKSLGQLATTMTFCIQGEVLKQLPKLLSPAELKKLAFLTTVYARTSPSQKEQIIHLIKENNCEILMCGDGTNDVGGLKKADIGIALVGLRDEPTKPKRAPGEPKTVKKKMPDPNEMMFDGPMYKQGDACVAAPFTSKHSNSIRCVLIVLRQGVCTLVTTIQTYKILTLSSLISAYSLSALHLEALKFSEIQSTCLGILGAVNYYYFSNSKPLKKLSSERPVKTIRNWYFIISIVGQTILHLYGMHYAIHEIGLKYTPEKHLKVTNDEEFVPTFLNTVVFLFSLMSQTSIFLFNHAGLPHMEGLAKNTRYLKFLIIPLVASLFLVFNLMPEISEMAELYFTDVPFEANLELAKVLAIVIVGNYVLERGLKFMKYRKFYEFV